jgi:hypothetical protein
MAPYLIFNGDFDNFVVRYVNYRRPSNEKSYNYIKDIKKAIGKIKKKTEFGNHFRHLWKIPNELKKSR